MSKPKFRKGQVVCFNSPWGKAFVKLTGAVDEDGAGRIYEFEQTSGFQWNTAREQSLRKLTRKEAGYER